MPNIICNNGISFNIVTWKHNSSHVTPLNLLACSKFKLLKIVTTSAKLY